MDQMLNSSADDSELALPPSASMSESGTGPRVCDPQQPLLEGTMERVRVSFGYKLGLVVVTLAMLLLPLIYLAFVGLFGYLVYYHATENRSILAWDLRGRAVIIKLVAYFAPLIIGALLFFFLIKPLFAPRSQESRPYSLNHDEAPLLFNLIGQICRAIGAPIPSRIDLDCNINAAASFRSGFKSFFGNDVSLLLGLPLVAGLTVQELAGVLAHEFGHFAQGTAMRLNFVIRRINLWFARVVYQRDVWDLWLIETSEEADFRVGWIFYVARFGVWVSRGILWFLMMIGHGISSFMSRQMEYDADRYEVRIGGTDAFAATIRHLQHLNLAQETVYQSLRTTFKRDRKVYDSLPELVVQRARDVPAEVQARLHAQCHQEKTSLFDSHPCDAERIRRSVLDNQPGMVRNFEPATTLFTNFSDLSRRVTLDYYHDLLGCEVPPDALLPVKQKEIDAAHDYAADQDQVKAYFKGVATSLRPIRLSDTKALSFRNPEALTADLLDAQQKLEQLLPGAQQAYAAFKDAESRELLLLQAHALLEAGAEFDPAQFALPDSAPETIQQLLTTATQQRTDAELALTPFEQAAKRRLISAVQLSRAPVMTKHLADLAAMRDDIDEMLWFLGELAGIFDPILELRHHCALLGALIGYREYYGGVESFSCKLTEIADRIRDTIATIQKKTAATRYPFPHATGAPFLGDYLKNKNYHPDEVELLLRDGNNHVEQVILLYYRALSRLVAVAQKIETVVASGTVIQPAPTLQSAPKLQAKIRQH